MVVFSLVCSVRPVSPFGNLSSSVGEEGALISWEYWGSEKNVYVEYLVENSKRINTPLFVLVLHIGDKRPLQYFISALYNWIEHLAATLMLALASVGPDVINKLVWDWTVNYLVLLLTRGECVSHTNISGMYLDKHHKKQHKHSSHTSWFGNNLYCLLSTSSEDEMHSVVAVRLSHTYGLIS